MIANRRVNYNFSLDRALEHCRELGKPLVILEALRCDYRWASDRLHRFVIDGMADNASHCAKHRLFYYPYVEPAVGAGKGLLEALAADACVVVTDEFPCFFLPRMVASAARKLAVRLEAVDSNGLLPLRAADHAFSRAFDFRRHLQKVLPAHLADFPSADPLSRAGIAGAATITRKDHRALASRDESAADRPIPALSIGFRSIIWSSRPNCVAATSEARKHLKEFVETETSGVQRKT